MKPILLLTACLMTLFVSAQKLTFHQKIKVGINAKADAKYQVIYTSITPAKENEVYDASTNVIITYQLAKKPNWGTARELKLGNGDGNLPVLFQKNAIYIADIKPEEGRLMVYFWPFANPAMAADITAANSFIKNNSFSIKLEDRTNLSFKSSAWHVGVMAIPLKIFLGTPDSVSAVQSSFNAGLYGGRRWGRTKYVKLPNQKEISTYQTSWSANVFAGLGKLDIDDKNTSDKGAKFKGTVASLSYGLMGAYHYKNFSVFISLGGDKPFGDRADKWLLKKKPWIGIGLGFDIL